MSDYKGAALMLPAMPRAKQLLADKGYDADWFRAALAKRRIAACIPSKSNRKTAIPYDAVLYKQRHKIENMFGRLKDWRRIHTRYDRCAHTYFSAICIAAAVVFVCAVYFAASICFFTGSKAAVNTALVNWAMWRQSLTAASTPSLISFCCNSMNSTGFFTAESR